MNFKILNYYENMKIIDFELKGNQVKFYLGSDDCHNYWGDDWNDKPYNEEAGSVYDRFILGWFVKTFDFDDIVMEPCNENYNSYFSKKDMKNRIVPCICVLPSKYKEEYTWYDSFSSISNNEHCIKYYFGDKIDETKEYIHLIKMMKEEDKYIEISIGKLNDYDSVTIEQRKLIILTIHQLSNMLKYMANDVYLQEIDDTTYVLLKSFSKNKAKNYFVKLLKENAKQLNYEITDDFIKSIKFKTEQNKEGYLNIQICSFSEDNFKIGKILI